MLRIGISTALLMIFTPAAQGAEQDAQAIDVESIKQRYWARGEEAELGVVQNRTYSKDKKFSLGLTGGAAISDPFLSIGQYGTSLSYHFSEYIGASILAWKFMATSSSALTTFNQYSDATANTVLPYAYIGGEINASLLYGKLSVLGKSIIYYDMYLMGGVGSVNKEGGPSLGYHVGLGQRFFISKHFSVKIDYRVVSYNENIIEKVNPNPAIRGTVVGNRQNYTHTILCGVDYMFDLFNKTPVTPASGGTP